MKKYYIFAIVFLVISYSLAGYSGYNQSLKREDEKTANKIEEIFGLVSDPYGNKTALPLDSTQIGNYPKGKYLYTKIREKAFSVCANFNITKQAYKDYLQPINAQERTEVIEEANKLKEVKIDFYGQQVLPKYIPVAGFGSIYQAGASKGVTCYVSLFNPSINASADDLKTADANDKADACDSQTNNSPYISSDLDKVDKTTKRLYLNTSGQFDVNADGTIKENPTHAYITYSDATIFCGADADITTVDKLVAGQQVSIDTDDFINAKRVNLVQ